MVAMVRLQLMQFDVDIAGDVNAELEWLVGRGGDLELVIWHRMHVKLVGDVAGDPEHDLFFTFACSVAFVGVTCP